MLIPPHRTRLLVLCGVLIFWLAGCQGTPTADSPSPLATPLAVSAPESPLIASATDLVLFQGTIRSGEQGFGVQFDQNLWEYANGHVFGPQLGHHHLIGCTLVLHDWGDDGAVLRTVTLAGREWTVLVTQSGGIMYKSPPFGFFLTSHTFESLVENTPCQQAGEHVIASFTELPAGDLPIIQVIGGSRANDEPWVTAHSQKGGFSVRHPASWGVVESELGALGLWPPTGQQQDRIWLSYLDFEKPEAADLQNWLARYFALGLGVPSSLTFRRVSLAVTDPSGPSQQVYNEEPPAVLRREYFVTHGRLVLHIGHVSQRVGQDEVLHRVADSLTFSADAPVNLTQLYAPEPPRTSTGYLTIEDLEQKLRDSNAVLEAINLRMQTGQTPTALLEKMSDWARLEYERLLLETAEYIQVMDQQRAIQPPLSPLPTPTP